MATPPSPNSTEPNEQQAQPQPGAFPPPAPAPRAGRGIGRGILRIGGMIVAALLVSFVFWYFNQTDAETSAVGDCLHNQGTESAPDLKKVDCASSDAEFKILGKFESTSDDSKCETVAKTELSYIQSGDDKHNVVLCLQTVSK